uniref:Uncharacterized protein n=1 Tax=Tetradesmus obliquus TaxID=3088 RepID=A0A383VUQ7_TETOB|eukprot:jgi/Sobl393_1/7689/SZX68512.1
MRHTADGCLPPEVLQQAGLQLLQALAAPVQLLKSPGWQAGSREATFGVFESSQQLYALRAAAEGAAAAGSSFASVQEGHLTALAAAHPEAYTALIDCCMRSNQLAAHDMFAAAQLLAPALTAVLSCQTLLANTAAVAGLASALTSLAKRAVQFTRAAARMQQEQQAAARPEATSAAAAAAAAAAYFPAAVPKIVDVLFKLPDMRNTAALVGSSSSSSNTSSSSSSSRNQVCASAVLLAVVLARSIVQLADAMEAAGPQLLFDSLAARPAFNVQWARTCLTACMMACSW